MAKNLIPEIAQMLGVEIGEEFEIKGREYIFHFVDNGLVAYRTDGSELPHENCLTHFLWLINGEEEIVKLPWKPTEGESFYTFTAAYGEWSVSLDVWAEEPCNYALLDKGWIYRTEKEAKAALPTVLKELSERRKS